MKSLNILTKINQLNPDALNEFHEQCSARAEVSGICRFLDAVANSMSLGSDCPISGAVLGRMTSAIIDVINEHIKSIENEKVSECSEVDMENN